VEQKYKSSFRKSAAKGLAPPFSKVDNVDNVDSIRFIIYSYNK
jgi:hypothetical protein